MVKIAVIARAARTRRHVHSCAPCNIFLRRCRIYRPRRRSRRLLHPKKRRNLRFEVQPPEQPLPNSRGLVKCGLFMVLGS